MTSLVNEDPTASDVLGPSATTLGDMVRAAPDFQRRVAAVERRAGTMLDKRGPDSTIGPAARQMIAVRGGARIEDLVPNPASAQVSFSAGDTVWARCKATGVNPCSGKPMSFDVMDICRFADGRLVEHWGLPDRFALLHQIGALPSPKRP
jgi:hypothetical protein